MHRHPHMITEVAVSRSGGRSLLELGRKGDVSVADGGVWMEG